MGSHVDAAQAAHLSRLRVPPCLRCGRGRGGRARQGGHGLVACARWRLYAGRRAAVTSRTRPCRWLLLEQQWPQRDGPHVLVVGAAPRAGRRGRDAAATTFTTTTHPATTHATATNTAAAVAAATTPAATCAAATAPTWIHGATLATTITPAAPTGAITAAAHTSAASSAATYAAAALPATAASVSTAATAAHTAQQY